MNKSTVLRTAIAGAVAAAGLSVGGIALAGAANGPGTATGVVAHDDRGGPDGHRMKFGGEGLAEELGVSREELAEAMAAVRDEVGPAGRRAVPPTEAQHEELRTTLAKALAEELDLTPEKVAAALEKVRTARTAQRRTDLSERLGQAVEDGELTAADKASVLKAFDAGVLGGPHLR